MINRPALLLSLALAAFPYCAQAETATVIPPPAHDAAASGSGLETAVLAGGCFWGVQAVFQHVKGVSSAVSGYAGGAQKDARYQVVSAGTTGHAESVKVTFDPKQISYGKLLHIYFSVAHDPTQLDRQGPDEGPQYRSEIFPQSEAQAKVAKDYIAQLEAAKAFKRPIVTKMSTMKQAFYPAEAYHQDYATLHPTNPYIAINDAPKVRNLQKMFASEWREKPALVREAKASETATPPAQSSGASLRRTPHSASRALSSSATKKRALSRS